MEREWNSKNCKNAFNRIQRQVATQNMNVNLEYPYLDNLCKETKSPRINDMITRTYYLGIARGIKMVDEGMTPITMSNLDNDK